MRGDARRRRPPMRGCRMMKNEPIATGKNANTPEKYEPMELLAAVTTMTHNVTTPARQARSRRRELDALDGPLGAEAAGRQ